MRSPRFVPRVVFTTAVVCVVPACRGANQPQVIVLAVAGYASGGSSGAGGGAGASGSSGQGGAANSGGSPVPTTTTITPPPRDPQIIVLAVQGFRGDESRKDPPPVSKERLRAKSTKSSGP